MGLRVQCDLNLCQFVENVCLDTEQVFQTHRLSKVFYSNYRSSLIYKLISPSTLTKIKHACLTVFRRKLILQPALVLQAKVCGRVYLELQIVLFLCIIFYLV